MGMLADFKLLEKHGFRLVPYKLAKTKEDAQKFARKIKYPVVLKIVSPDIIHKTEINGVRIGIKNDKMLGLEFEDIMESAREKKIKVDGILVQKMARKGLELIIGGKKDEQFGYMVVVGLGGIYVEVFRDITARICPITKTDVAEMISELKAHPLIIGARGRKPINISSLEQLMIRVCRFMGKENIKELDLNPVVFDEKGCDIVDVRFRMD